MRQAMALLWAVTLVFVEVPVRFCGFDKVVVTFGAGNIDAYCQAVADVIAKKG